MRKERPRADRQKQITRYEKRWPDEYDRELYNSRIIV